jgi:hypothetical protein
MIEKNYTLSRLESETQINFNDEEPSAYLYVCNKSMQRRLANLGILPIREDQYSKYYVIPKSWIKINAPKKLSEEAKEILRARMQKIHGLPKQVLEENETE